MIPVCFLNFFFSFFIFFLFYILRPFTSCLDELVLARKQNKRNPPDWSLFPTEELLFIKSCCLLAFVGSCSLQRAALCKELLFGKNCHLRSAAKYKLLCQLCHSSCHRHVTICVTVIDGNFDGNFWNQIVYTSQYQAKSCFFSYGFPEQPFQHTLFWCYFLPLFFFP